MLRKKLNKALIESSGSELQIIEVKNSSEPAGNQTQEQPDSSTVLAMISIDAAYRT